MIYKIAWVGLGLFLMAGVVYLGSIGITIAKYAVQMEIPIQKFIKK